MYYILRVSIVVICALAIIVSAQNSKIYKMCIPHIYHRNCENLLKEPSQAGVLIECISGRDRMECLEKVNKHEADFVAVDPEDMYVAYHLNNQHFQVISEIRTQVEKDAEFRYEGIILVHKTSDIHSLKDLKGRKSCHTGFGRNVGYKIPITKLKKHGILKVSMDATLSPTERELKALSELFTESCLVGKYSPHPEIDTYLKKTYSNLCALCEKPDQCNYPDNYSGYEGAIRCLVENGGDVAFTKTSYVKKYFGLLNDGSKKISADDYEYLCEDGSRRPITGPACSWAQRPWQGYMTNRDTVGERSSLERLQKRIDSYYKIAQQSENKEAAESLLVKGALVLHEKSDPIQPKEYLEHAGYKDVIERDGSISQKIRLCVTNEIELQKCQTLENAAYSRDIRPEFDCLQHSKAECIQRIHEHEADAVVLSAEDYQMARNKNLQPIVYEMYGDDDVYVALVDSNLSEEMLSKASINFNQANKRQHYAARLLNYNRQKSTCISPVDDGQIQITHASEIHKYQGKSLLCPKFTKMDTSEYRNCNVETVLPKAVFGRNELTTNEIINIVHAFTLLSERFGPNGMFKDVFSLFDEYLPGKNDVIFSDNAIALRTYFKPNNNIDEATFNNLQCV